MEPTPLRRNNQSDNGYSEGRTTDLFKPLSYTSHIPLYLYFQRVTPQRVTPMILSTTTGPVNWDSIDIRQNLGEIHGEFILDKQ
ncbi:MAG: hypothetical protein MAG451_01127 [Anaerolineales bacterium]|nr:hypothetical protein [Anaerolineales bacterium]